jgi:hypothetical protein
MISDGRKVEVRRARSGSGDVVGTAVVGGEEERDGDVGGVGVGRGAEMKGEPVVVDGGDVLECQEQKV